MNYQVKRGKKNNNYYAITKEKRKNMKEVQYGKDFICPCCGKSFWTSYMEGWAYKVNKIPYCSYTCMRKAEKEYLNTHNIRRKYAKTVRSKK